VSVALLASACSSGDSGDPGDAASGDAASDDGSRSEDGSATDDDGSGAEAVYPGEAWDTIDPEEAGFDPAVLEELAAEAGANRSTCLLVTRHGQLVGEWYWNGSDATTNQEVFSATKSFTSTLVGMAQADGDLDIDDRASEYIPEWRDTDSAEVTVENLISNDSGRHWDYATDYQRMTGAEDRTGFAIGLSQDAPPGETWVYNNSAIQTLDAVLEAATGERPTDFAEERLFEPLGMAHSEMTTDESGNTNMFFGLTSTCQDMARFGYLFLRHGNWDGEQVVPEEWVEAATGRASQDLNAGYGYLWWLNRQGSQGSGVATAGAPASDEPTQIVPGGPEDMFWALGLGNQIIQVDPGSDTVVVRLGGPDTPGGLGANFTARVVQEALVDP
jgi:CubicO group peptidase (beta-lactamase class C family)